MYERFGRQVTLFFATGLIAGSVMFGSCTAWAQQKQKASFDAPATSNKYTQQYTIDVGDAPSHQIRIFELQRTYGSNSPTIEGVHIKESWIRGTTDFTELNGLGTAYVTYVMGNGDKIYGRASYIAHSVAGANGKNALKNLTAVTVTGGTGKFLGIRGIVRAETSADPATGTNQNKSEMEYWMEK